jgi:hypothetical protein
MKSNVFVARLAGGAVASTMACLMPQNHTEANAGSLGGYEATATDKAILTEGDTDHSSDEAATVTMAKNPTEWDKKMEQEFRKLALGEAKGSLSREQVARLEELTDWRNSLLDPPPPEEILLQIKRDRLLEKTEELLRAYVEFQEATGKTRAAA